MMIRSAVADDLPAVHGLLAEAGLVLGGLAELGDGLIVAEHDGRVVGAVGVERHGPDALLRSLVVAPPVRGTGLGDALTAAAVEHAKRATLDAIWLLTETAEPFFAARGFVRMDRAGAPTAIAASHEFSKACPASAAFMRRALA